MLQCVELSFWKGWIQSAHLLICCFFSFSVCGNKNTATNPNQYSTQDTRIETTNQAILATNPERPTRQKDMIVIVRGRDQSHSSNNSAGYNSIGKIFIFLTSALLLLNIL